MLHKNQMTAREGIVLLVVITMLSLFAAVALSFVFYAEAEAVAMKYTKESLQPYQADVDPEMLLNFFLGAQIYDSGDMVGGSDYVNVANALRGHSFARNLYGYDPARPNFTPHSGPGTPPAYLDTNVGGFPGLYLPNYTYFASDGFVRDPERLGNRAKPTDAVTATYYGANVPWTAADMSNMFLAAVNAKGEVLMPSFYRPWAGNPTAGMTIGGLDSTTNPNWSTSPPAANMAWLKYASLRPMPYVHPNFPPPEDGGGDVKNLDWGPGTPKPGGGYFNNDSIWMDLGFPILTAMNGKKYKPLFAPLIMDMEGKLNINAAGNIRGTDAGGNPIHASNSGLGVWEINLNQALTNADWVNLFKGNSTAGVTGRYGPDNFPSLKGNSIPLTVGGTPTPFFGQGDLDGTQEPVGWKTGDPTGGLLSKKIFYPGEATNPNPVFVAWPYFDPASYTNGDEYEQTNHPWLFNPLFPKDKTWAKLDVTAPSGAASDDLTFSPYQLEALYRYGGTGSPGLRSDLFRLSPGNFNDTTNDKYRRRQRMITTLGWDLGRPGLIPWLYTPDMPPIPYTMAAGTLNPTGGSFPYADPTKAVPVPGGEFAPLQYRATTVADDANLQLAMKKLNLRRSLPDFPKVDATTGRLDTTTVNAATGKTYFSEALTARQTFAKDIFDLLRYVTMGAKPTDALPDMTARPDEYSACRWLAQLAVNIVDYRDSDDYITPFNWNTANSGIAGYVPEWVFGTEIPRLVVNEAYCEAIDDPLDATKYKLNFWVELLNPLIQDKNIPEPISGSPAAARLYSDQGGQTTYAMYQLYVLSGKDAALRGFTNSTGAPDPALVRLQVSDYTADAASNGKAADAHIVQALGSTYFGANGDNAGFYILGPADNFPGTDPNIPIATLRIKEQQLNMGAQQNAMNYSVANNTDLTTLTHTVLLQRLACPYLDPQTEPDPTKWPAAQQYYNPYITVDYFEGLNVNNAAGMTPTPVDQRLSQGRKQPYAAHSSQIVVQKPAVALLNQPQHTFFMHNSSTAVAGTAPPDQTLESMLTLPFDWLVHLDRNLTSPAELLHVSGFRPHELTQQFMRPDNVAPLPTRFAHQAPWTTPEARIYRVLEFLDAGHRAQGISVDGRYPGKININTIWDIEVLRSLCDANGASYFTAAQVDKLYDDLMKSRNPTTVAGQVVDPIGGAMYTPAYGDVPFKSFTAGFTSATTGLEETLLRKHPSDPTRRLFDTDMTVAAPGIPKDHPYLKNEVLRKIFNNVTTRSNVFAVYVTVGFFEVTETTDAANNTIYQLGKEIGKAEGRHIRHRMFAIVDRTEMQLFNTTSPSIPAGNQTVTPTSMTGTAANGKSYTIQKGMWLTVRSDEAMEDVLVTDVGPPGPTPTTFNATFLRNHLNNRVIIVRGNPGPTPGYNARKDTGVVPYFSIIR